MLIAIKVGNEQSIRRIRQLGEKFSVQVERRLGSPKGEDKERNEDDGENQKSLSHLRSPLYLKRSFPCPITLAHQFAHRLKLVATETKPAKAG
jgi:hypothetical protein